MTQAQGNYEAAHRHWSSVASNLNGMLGGYERLHVPDINGSRQFLDELAKKNFLSTFGRALDCGSGIGRVTKHLLLPAFDSVDMVDFAEQFIEQSKEYIGEGANQKRIGHRFVESLHTFSPALGQYDLIWVQWVTGHLTDDHFVEFLRRCKAGLGPGGCIVVKDNVTRGFDVELDTTDHSCTRPLDSLHAIFERADCQVVLERRQLHFPKEIYPVRMFAFKG